MKDVPKKISSELVNENPWWKYRKDVFELPDGARFEYFYGETRGAAMVVPMLSDGRLVIVRQYRVLTEEFSVEFPCGGIAENEQPIAAAARELREETGCQAENLIYLGACDSSKGCFKDKMHVYFAPYVKQLNEPMGDKTEDIEVIFRRVDEFEDMIRRGEINDGQTLAAWTLSRDHVLKEIS